MPGGGVGAVGQQCSDDTPDSTETRLQSLERQFNDLKTQYKQDMAARDRRISELESRVHTNQPGGDHYEKEKNDILQQIDAGTANDVFSHPAVSFNPDIAVVTNFLGSWSNNHQDKALNRLDVGEAELDMRAAVDPRADGVLILSFERDATNPLFQDEELEGPDTAVGIEEGYINLHDFGIPNLTAKVGRFHVRFGRQNILHSHDLPTSDSPFVNQSFLAPEALSDAGVSLSYLIPNPWGQYFEVVTEVLAGEGADVESPTLNGDLNVSHPAINTHLLWNTDVAENWNLEIGGSYLRGRHDMSDGMHEYGNTNLFGADVTLMRTDPTGGFNNQLLQGEMIYGLTDQADGHRADSVGAYLLGQQQINRDWYTGVRLDWTEDANDANREVWGVSPYVSWYLSEFLRLRLEYQHKGGDIDRDTDLLYFQFTWIFGAHPPHPYWAMH